MKKYIYLLLAIAFFILPFSNYAQNNALDFDGVNDYIQTTYDPDLSNWTVECWVKGDSEPSTTAGERIIHGGYNFAMNWGHNNNDFRGTIEFYNEVNGFIGERTYFAASFGTLEADVWYHLVGTYDGMNLKAYKNGVLITDNAVPHGDAVSETASVTIGAATNGAVPFPGQIDEMRIWSDVRTLDEIRSNMYQELTGTEGNLIAYYKLNETSGTNANDSQSSSNYDGTLTNMTGTEWFPSPAFFGPKNALHFVLDDYVAIPSIFGLGTTSVTLECWAKPNTASEGGAFIHIGDHNVGYGIGMGNSSWDNKGNQLIVLYDMKRWIETGVNIGTGWHHVVLTIDANGDPSVFLDGENVYSDTGLDDPHTPTGSSSIGSTQNSTRSLSSGKIDEVRIWNDVRTQTEIRENMARTLTGDEANLVAYYNLDGNVVADLSGNGNDGTIGGEGDEFATSAAFNTWLNTNTTSWATAVNWSLGSIPSSTDNVGIYSSSANDPIISSGGTGDCNNLVIESGADLTIESGGSLISTGFIQGSATIERTISDGVWHLIAAPNNNTTSSTFSGDYLQTWDEATATWEEITETTTALTPVQGYGFWGVAKSTTHSFEGTPNTGDQSLALSYTEVADSTRDGANCLGNPYPSSIDWEGLRSTYGAVNYWTGTQYATWNGSGTGTNGGVQYIPPMQGFFIVVSSSGTFSLANSNRTHNGASTYFKETEEIPSNSIMLTAYSNAGTDELFIRFDESTSPYFELEHDAYKFLSNTEGLSELFSFSDLDKLTIDVRPETDIIQLGFKNNLNGVYQIGIKEMDGIAEAIIEDTKLNFYHDLSEGVYEFGWLTNDSEERFILHLKATGIDDLANLTTQIFAYQKTINIRSSGKLNNAHLNIVDMMGRTVYEQILVDGQNESITLALEDGVYLVQLVSDGGTEVEKVILK